MQLVELLVLLLLACVVLAWLARRARVPYPIALVLGGVALGFAPRLPRMEFDPNLVVVIVLPPILYQAALFTSWRDFRENARAISLLAVGLVVATTVAVAVTARWLLPDLPWAAAFALGAIVSPPDAVAATAVLGRMQIPRRIVTILEGESLVNDASGLVLYKWQVTVVGWCGMRGIVSLAAALALPVAMHDGAAFPGRELIVFLAFVIILITLVLPGLTLAPLIRWLHVGGDWNVHEERRLARESTARAALREIHHFEQHGDITGAVAAHLREDYEARLARALPHGLLYAPEADPLIRGRRAAVAAERRELIRLWREGKIGDEVLHEIERELDFESARLGT